MFSNLTGKPWIIVKVSIFNRWANWLWPNNSVSTVTFAQQNWWIAGVLLLRTSLEAPVWPNSIFARNKGKIKDWKILNSFKMSMFQTLFIDKKSICNLSFFVIWIALDSGLPYKSQGHKMPAVLGRPKGCHGPRRLFRRPGKLGTRTQHLFVSCARF